MKIYVVMIACNEDEYTDIHSDKAFISKEKAQEYCDNKNKWVKEETIKHLKKYLKEYYTDEEVEEIIKDNTYDEYYIEEIELEDAGTSSHAE